MTYARKLLAVLAIAVAGAAAAAGPAAAATPSRDDFKYFAVVDCGSGPIEVGSGLNMWSQLVDLETGARYQPVAWDVSGDGFAYEVAKGGATRKKAVVECSYDDGAAKGAITVRKL